MTENEQKADECHLELVSLANSKIIDYFILIAYDRLRTFLILFYIIILYYHFSANIEINSYIIFNLLQILNYLLKYHQ